MSERAAMKRRVRGLLHGSWLSPLLALVLAALPILLLVVPVVLLMKPAGFVSPLDMELASSSSDLRTIALMLFSSLSDPLKIVMPLVGWLPLAGALLAICLFVAMPICVSTAGYFLSFLRGKNPKPTAVYNCFSGRYPRYFGGMAYRILWVFIWFAVSVLLPVALILCSAIIASLFDVGLRQIYIFGGIAIGAVIWLVVFFFVFVNRMLAYSLTPSCLAAQPRLPAYRALRLSRKLMRGSKWRLLGLMLSFISYFLPAIIAGILLPLLALFGARLGLSAALIGYIRIGLWAVIGLNQLVWLYLSPYIAASLNAFYIERKREALMDEEVSPEDFAGKPAEADKATDAAANKTTRKQS